MVETIEVKNKIRKFIAETAFVPEEKIEDATMIFNEGIFDSMGFLSLINFIEDNFDVKAEDAELLEENFESVEAISAFVIRKAN